MRIPILSIVLLVLFSGAACKPRHAESTKQASVSTPISAPQSAPIDISEDEEKGFLSLYDDRADHPYNRLHRALFASRQVVNRTPCLTKPKKDCETLDTQVAAMVGLVPGRSEYVETAPLLAGRDVRFLTAPRRFSEAMSALRDASQMATSSTPSSPLVAMLLQHDLWERFDTIEAALRASSDGPASSESASLRMLRDEIGTLMRKLALPVQAMEKLPSNLDAIDRAHPDLIGGLAQSLRDSDGKWLEVATRASERPAGMGSPLVEGTRHAMMAGYRAAFRRFVQIPDGLAKDVRGADWLQRALAEQPASLELPTGARVVIMETPLVLSAAGEITPLPIVSLVEARVIGAKPETPAAKIQLPRLGFEVLDARRARLRQPGFPGGGLERLPFDAPFPLGGTCSPNPSTLLPVRATCLLCHGVTGERLIGTMSHGPQELRVNRDGSLQVRVTIDAKKARPDFAALRALFSR